MWIFSQRQWLTGAVALLLAAWSFALGLGRSSGALADDTTARAAGAENRAVSFLKEVRPILAQHCFAVPRTRRGDAQGKASPRSEGQGLRRPRGQARDRTGRPGGLTRLGADHHRRRRRADAARRNGGAAHGEADRDIEDVDRAGRPVGRSLVIPSAQEARDSPRSPTKRGCAIRSTPSCSRGWIAST